MKKLFFGLFGIFIAYNAVAADCSNDQMEYNDTCIDAPFTLTTSATDSFSFKMSAAGTFYVDWGDGDIQQIVRSNNTETTYTHTYEGDYATQTHIVRFGGNATGYISGSNVAAVRFDTNATKIKSISGSLGAIFGTITTPRIGIGQPRFVNLFNGASNLTGTIPEDLFKGVHGAPVSSMFAQLFYKCGNLTSQIPEKLFCSDPDNPNITNCIYGEPQPGIFNRTFYQTNLTGQIPEKLFVGIRGTPAQSMFENTFVGCKFTGSIPENLFAGISGAPAISMFRETFSYNSNLTGPIPENLFAGIKGTPANNMFKQTFYNCTKLKSFTYKNNIVSYVPKTFLENITTHSDSTQTENMFSNTALSSSCPSGTYNVTRTQFNNAGKPWCEVCYTAGNNVCYPHILHVGDDVVYLKSISTDTPTTPALYVSLEDEVFFANTVKKPSAEHTPIKMNKNAQHSFMVNYNGEDYYICDDTTCPITE